MGVVTDVYVYNNEMKYSISKFEKFPEIIKTVKYYDTNKNIVEIPEVRKIREKNRDEYEKQKIQNLEMVNYIAMRHNQKLV